MTLTSDLSAMSKQELIPIGLSAFIFILHACVCAHTHEQGKIMIPISFCNRIPALVEIRKLP